MLIRTVLFLLTVSLGFAYNPQPANPSEGEKQLEAALEASPSEAVKIQIAKEMLELFPDDIAMGRKAQNIIKGSSEDHVAFFKARYDANRTSATSYLYARATGEAKQMAEQSAWIIHNDPTNFWGDYMAAIAVWETENPPLEEVAKLLNSAIEKDPSRIEAYYAVASAYEEMKKWDEASEAYRAAMIVDPEDSSIKLSLAGIYAQTRDASKYFETVNAFLPDEPVTASAELVKGGQLTPESLQGHATVLDFFEYWCGPCVNHSLPELNQLKAEGKLPFKVYSVHTEGMHEKAVTLINGKDKNGKDWALDFVWGSEELSNQMGGVKVYPSYYVLDSKGVPRAILVGHSPTTVETLQWLIEQIEKRS